MEMDLKNYVSKFLNDFSIEVMPRTFEKLEFTKSLWPEKTRVYIAHLEGTRIEDMIFTAKKLISEDFVPMPHFPARLIKNKKILETWINKCSYLERFYIFPDWFNNLLWFTGNGYREKNNLVMLVPFY